MLHKADEKLYTSISMQCKSFCVPTIGTLPPVDRFLADNDVVEVGETKFTVLHTPGHSPGSVCFYSEKNSLLLSGDTMFYGSYGRTDLWGGNESQLFQSLKRLKQLPKNVVVVTGHGPMTTIGNECRDSYY